MTQKTFHAQHTGLAKRRHLIGIALDQSAIQANIDPQAYAVQVINMVVGGVAIVDSLDVLLPNDPKRGTTRDRQVRELIRMARASLYVPG